MLVAESETGGIIGYSAVHWLPHLLLAGPEGYVSELFVRRSQRGNGIGRMLLEEVKRRAAERGCSRLSLLNGRIRESYERGFYRKAGWTERPDLVNFFLPLPANEYCKSLP